MAEKPTRAEYLECAADCEARAAGEGDDEARERLLKWHRFSASWPSPPLILSLERQFGAAIRWE